jgi:hypothetical protein
MPWDGDGQQFDPFFCILAIPLKNSLLSGATTAGGPGFNGYWDI